MDIFDYPMTIGYNISMPETDFLALDRIHAKLLKLQDFTNRPEISRDEDVLEPTPFELRDERSGLYVVHLDPTTRLVTIVDGDPQNIRLFRPSTRPEGIG